MPSILAEVTDDVLRPIAQSWPLLRELELDPNRRRRGLVKAAGMFRGLVSLAELCPHLEKLGIDLDAGPALEVEVAPAKSTVKKLDVSMFSPTHVPDDTANATLDHVAKIWPNRLWSICRREERLRS